MKPPPRTLTDLLDPGREFRTRDAVLLLRYQKNQLSRTSREYMRLRDSLKYIAESGEITHLGQSVLKHYRIQRELHAQVKRSGGSPANH
ncbi:hypothetical protein Rctr85_022 [Virus Rctr85]|nr:hypothetical protein Rctr85_022 [Virus Rctr85]